MAERQTISMFDFRNGIRNSNENPLAYPKDALWDGLNLELVNGGLRTRRGTTPMSATGLPVGCEVMAIYQARFPTNKSSYLVVQIREAAAQPGEWTEGASIGIDNGRMFHSAVWNSTAERMIVFGGLRPDNIYWDTATPLGDLWEYSPDADTWIERTPTGDLPSARSDHTAVYIPSLDKMMIVGGDGSTDTLGEFWLYDYATNAWTVQVTTGAYPDPTDTSLHRRENLVDACAFMVGENALCVLTGLDGYHLLDLTTMVWTRVNLTIPDYGWQHQFAAVFDATESVIYLANGVGQDTVSPAVFALNFPATEDQAWVDVTPSPEDQSPCYGNAAIFYSGILLSALGAFYNGEGGTYFYTWICSTYDSSTEEWIRTETEALPGRYGHTAVVTESGLVLIHGGISDDGAEPPDPKVYTLHDDTWRMQQT